MSMVELEQLIDALQADLPADEFVERGMSVQGTFGEIDDPVLIGPDGTPIMTWKEGYPYDERMSRQEYDEEKRLLQIELLKLQSWLQQTGHKVCLVFEGRDAAGKGGTIKRFMEHLNPRLARVVALGIPTQREQGQWYFQRWIGHLPTAEKSSCSTDRGTHGPSSTVSWATARPTKTSSSCVTYLSSNAPSRHPT